jgi:glycerol-3-phosphate dehydrogenase
LTRGRAATARLEPLPGGTLDRADPALDAALRRHGSAVDPDVLAHLLDWYGGEAARVLESAVTRRLTARLAPDRPFIAGEIAWACETAGALRLADAVLRRTRMGATGHPGQAALEAAADVMAGLHGWDAGRRAEEIAEVERRFLVPAL